MSLILPHPYILNVLGSCGAGKTNVCKYIITTGIEEFEYVIVITSTGFIGNFDFLNKLKKPNKVLPIIDVEKNIRMIMKKQREYFMKKVQSRLLIVMDDIMGSINMYSNEMKRLLSTYRNFNISIIFICQYASCTPTYIRELAPFNIVFNQTTASSLKCVYESYFRDIDTLKDFIKWFRNQLNQPFTFFFIDKLNKKKTICKAPEMNI